MGDGWRRWGERGQERGGREDESWRRKAEEEKDDKDDSITDSLSPDRLGGRRPSRVLYSEPNAVFASQGDVKLPHHSPRVSSNSNLLETNGDARPILTVPLREINAGDLGRDSPFNIDTKIRSRLVTPETGIAVEVEATTDSGACVNVMDYDFWDRNKASLGDLDAADFNVSVADGRKLTTSGAITCKVDIPHEAGAYTSVTRFQVIKSSDEWEILLGKPWL
jgi:uncharacterized protein YaiE (UPF0345 family)